MKTKPIHRRGLAAIGILLLLVVVNGLADSTKLYLGGETRFVYRTETGSSRIELATTVITPLDDGRYRVVTTTEELANPDDIRLGFFGGASQWLGLQVGEGASALFDLSPLGALADQVLEPQKTYLLPDGGKLQTEERVMVAGLAGVEGLYTQADTPGAIIRVVLADDLYIRQFLPFPLRVQLEYEDTASAGSEEEGTLDRSFSGHIELVEYVHTPSEGNSP